MVAFNIVPSENKPDDVLGLSCRAPHCRLITGISTDSTCRIYVLEVYIYEEITDR